MASRATRPEIPDEQPPEQSGRGIPPPGDEPAPPYYVATEALFIDNQFGRAHNPGDRVPADHVDRYGWADKVRRSNGPFEPQPAAPYTKPETTTGQATSKEGDA